jgi:hypothetical protein
MIIHAIRLKDDTRCVIILVKSTTTRWVWLGDCRSDVKLGIGGLCGSKFGCDPFASGSWIISEGGGSTTGGGELEDAAAANVKADLGEGATRTSTISNRASVGATTDHADRPISTVLFSCWLLRTTRTSRQILSRSTSLSSGKDSVAIFMARWMGLNQSATMARFKE